MFLQIVQRILLLLSIEVLWSTEALSVDGESEVLALKLFFN